MRESRFFQNCGAFCFDLYWKYHDFEWNEIRATVFIKWMDFAKVFHYWENNSEFWLGNSLNKLDLLIPQDPCSITRSCRRVSIHNWFYSQYVHVISNEFSKELNWFICNSHTYVFNIQRTKVRSENIFFMPFLDSNKFQVDHSLIVMKVSKFSISKV